MEKFFFQVCVLQIEEVIQFEDNRHVLARAAARSRLKFVCFLYLMYLEFEEWLQIEEGTRFTNNELISPQRVPLTAISKPIADDF